MPDEDDGLRLQALLLCDHANIREGMLSVLSAGITRAALVAYPGNMPAYLAMLIYIPADRVEQAHQCTVKFKYPESANVAAGADIQFKASAETFAGEGLTLPIAVPLHTISFPEPGQVDLQVGINGRHAGDLSFWLLPSGTAPSDLQ